VVRGVIRKVDQFLSRPDVPAGPKKQSTRKQKRRRTSLTHS
jgi:hypothetical protein